MDEQDTRKFEQAPEQPTQRMDDTPAPVPSQPACPRGHGPLMEVEVHVPGASGRLELKRPGVWFGLAGGISQVGAWACTKCGYVEFFAYEPSELTRRD